MKKLACLAVLLLTSNMVAAAPKTMLHKAPGVLESYKDAMYAVLEGKEIRFAMAPEQCTVDGKRVEKPGFAFGFFTPEEMIVTNDMSIAASMHHFTTHDPHSPGKAVYQYAAFKVSPDNMMTVAVEVFDAAYHTPISSKTVYQCEMGVGGVVVVK